MKKSLAVIGAPQSSNNNPSVVWQPEPLEHPSIGVFSVSDRVDCSGFVFALIKAAESEHKTLRAYAHSAIVDDWRRLLGNRIESLIDLGTESSIALSRYSESDSVGLVLGYESMCLLRPKRSVLLTGFLPTSKWRQPLATYADGVDVQLSLPRSRFAHELLLGL